LKQLRHTATNKPCKNLVEPTGDGMWGTRHSTVMSDGGTRCEFKPRIQGILSKTQWEKEGGRNSTDPLGEWELLDVQSHGAIISQDAAQ